MICHLVTHGNIHTQIIRTKIKIGLQRYDNKIVNLISIIFNGRVNIYDVQVISWVGLEPTMLH